MSPQAVRDGPWIMKQKMHSSACASEIIFNVKHLLAVHNGNLLKIVVVGHVDRKESTLVGRLLNDTDSLPKGKVEAVDEMCKRRGMPFEWAFVTDALRAERDQGGITIDASHIRFAVRDYVLIDAPGHREFLRT